MYNLLAPLRIIEAASFIAAPSAGLYLAQMGAQVIRIDQLGGGLDYHRWPIATNGSSFYWEGLNKVKKSVVIDLSRPEGRELAAALITAPGEQAGLFVTNFPAAGFLSHKALATRRADLVTIRLMGRASGESAVDYTVNCAVGIPQITGPNSLGEQPVNHALPAWDLLAGSYAAFALLAAERNRRLTGRGLEVRVPLFDVGIGTVANLGQLAEVLSTGIDRARYGNELFGAFGRDFLTADGKRLMLIAITPRQWSGLVAALDLGAAVKAIETVRGVSFAREEGLRFVHRDILTPLVQGAIAQRTAAELAALLDRWECCWSFYQTTSEAARSNLVTNNPIFSTVEHPSGVAYPTPGAFATIETLERQAPTPAPRLGEHTNEILTTVLGLSPAAIAALHDEGVVGGPRA